jgi:glycosyltransferase involved in cell wall biosynthesis
MNRIAIFHPIFTGGGGEAVCLNTIEALQDDFAIDLFTISNIDVEELNNYYDTSVSADLNIYSNSLPSKFSRLISSALSSLSFNEARLSATIYNQLLQSKLETDQYSVVISTFNEFPFPIPSICYVHFPNFNRGELPKELYTSGGLNLLLNKMLDIWMGDSFESKDEILANSNWTSKHFSEIYGKEAKTIYPPVVTESFSPKSWESREDGIVSIGRIIPGKRTKVLIKILDHIRELGGSLHLHIVGPGGESHYYDEVLTLVEQREYIHLEGKISRSELASLVSTHKYGLHANKYEHFGMAVAELVAGGAIPFVHNSGGQREIVNNSHNLMYDDPKECAKKIYQTSNDVSKQSELRQQLPDIESNFGAERFQEDIKSLVINHIE